MDDMYKCVLSDIMPEDEREEVIPIFCSVMGQILVSQELLPMSALNVMQMYFPYDYDHYNVNLVMNHLGSLLVGGRKFSYSHTSPPCILL
jgi:hypothetical protein